MSRLFTMIQQGTSSIKIQISQKCTMLSSLLHTVKKPLNLSDTYSNTTGSRPLDIPDRIITQNLVLEQNMKRIFYDLVFCQGYSKVDF